PRWRRTQPKIEVQARRDRHFLLKTIYYLDAVVEPVRMVKLLGGGRILQPPRAVGPDMDFAHGADDAGHQDFLDAAACRRGMPLVADLGRQLRVFCGGLADEAGFPNVIRKGLLAVDVLAVRQCKKSGKGVRVLGSGYYDCIEVVRVIEDAPKIGK